MIDIEHLKAWIGRTEESIDIASAAPLAGLAALLDHDAPPWIARELPPLAHWLYFLPRARQSEIDADGHAKRGGFLPPVPLPRRMWAGSRVTFHSPVIVGAAMTRRSRVIAVEGKSGASGEMVFVALNHEIHAQGSTAIVEEQDIVYREAAVSSQFAKSPGASEPKESEWTRTIVPNPVQLFRFSALTFNGHRIHYDRDYARNVEGYPGLVVHGPYTATLLVDHYLRRNPGTRIASLTFRAMRPLFDTARFNLCGRITPDGADLWARAPSGETAMMLNLVV